MGDCLTNYIICLYYGKCLLPLLLPTFLLPPKPSACRREGWEGWGMPFPQPYPRCQLPAALTGALQGLVLCQEGEEEEEMTWHGGCRWEMPPFPHHPGCPNWGGRWEDTYPTFCLGHYSPCDLVVDDILMEIHALCLDGLGLPGRGLGAALAL